jgi:Coproporphyrinogen III oxidase
MSTPDSNAVRNWLLSLQERIVSSVEAIDGKPFSVTAGNVRKVAVVSPA